MNERAISLLEQMLAAKPASFNDKPVVSGPLMGHNMQQPASPFGGEAERFLTLVRQAEFASLPSLAVVVAVNGGGGGRPMIARAFGATPLGNLNITTGTALALPTTTLDTGKNLIVVAGGAITQSGALTVPGTTSLTALAG